MASASSESSINLSVTHDDIVELEITEVDETLLRNLLEESMNEEVREDAAYSLAVNNKQELEHFGDLDWNDMMDIAAPGLPMDENMMVWYDMVGMTDFARNADCFEFYSGASSDETNYWFLWQE